VRVHPPSDGTAAPAQSATLGDRVEGLDRRRACRLPSCSSGGEVLVSKVEEKEKSPGEEAADALKVFLVRISEIFGVFDLSFIVAGVVCLGAILFGVYVLDGWDKLPAWVSGKWEAVHVIAAILTSYVLGLVCFALGRSVTRRMHGNFHEKLRDALRRFELDARYRQHLAHPDLLYTRLWAEARQSKKLSPSYNLLTRYWVMAAMCDGLAAAFFVWAALGAYWMSTPHAPSLRVALPIELGLVLAMVLCATEALRYHHAQMYELLATLAHEHEGAASSKPRE
jgi:hypothetical protein